MIAGGEAHERGRADFEEVRGNWPYAFVNFDGQAGRIVDELRSNHVVMAYGDHVASLAALPDLWNIEQVVI